MQSGLLTEWQIAGNKESMPEKGWPQPCLLFYFSLGIHYQPLFKLFFLRSGQETGPTVIAMPQVKWPSPGAVEHQRSQGLTDLWEDSAAH